MIAISKILLALSWLLHHEVIAFGKSRGFVLRMPRRIIDVDWNRHHLGVDGMMFLRETMAAGWVPGWWFGFCPMIDMWHIFISKWFQYSYPERHVMVASNSQLNMEGSCNYLSGRQELWASWFPISLPRIFFKRVVKQPRELVLNA